MSDTRISIIAAISSSNRALGHRNELLWRIPDDLVRFKALTNGHPVIMGRKTWESLPDEYRPLPGRTNIVVTHQQGYEAIGAEVVPSLEDAIEVARAAEGGAGSDNSSGEIFIIGGGEIYREAIFRADRLYLTLIDDEKEADVFFPQYEDIFTKTLSSESREWNDLHYHWVDLERS